MKNTKLVSMLLGLLLLPVLLTAGEQVAVAQTPPAAQAREDQFKRLIDLLEKQSNDKDRVIADKDAVIAALRKQIENFQELDKNSTARIAVLQEQIGTLRETRTQLQTQMDARDIIIREQNARIANRDQAIELVKELAKIGKRTTWEKVVEAIPSIAGIIALAAAK